MLDARALQAAVDSCGKKYGSVCTNRDVFDFCRLQFAESYGAMCIINTTIPYRLCV